MPQRGPFLAFFRWREKHYCWDGKQHNQSTGGVPAFVLEYRKEEARKSAQFDEEMSGAAKKPAADAARRAAGLPSLAEARRAQAYQHRAALNPALARSGGSPASRSLPFDGLGEGMERGTVIEKLGQAHGAMSNLGPAFTRGRTRQTG